MHVDSSTIKRGNKSYTRHLLRTSYREDGKVKKKTLLNLSSCSDDEIQAIKLALRHKKDLTSLASLKDVKTVLGKRIGAVWALKAVAERTGLAKALGSDRNGRLALLQLIVRVAEQGSRLSAVRFAQKHAVCEILGIQKLNENDLYENLAWLAKNQEKIENNLFQQRFAQKPPTLFLYDVTSSYLEGEHNELAAYGYNRDKKKGKKQIVIGLLAGADGLPVAVRVFEGNTVDTKTVAEQIRTLANNFHVKQVTIVGDRGMLKGPQIDALPDDFRFVSAISKPQIRKMLGEGLLQMELFGDEVCEVKAKGLRYILRRNPIRREQIALNRKSKLASVQKLAQQQTDYLAAHPRAEPDKAALRVSERIKKLKIDKWASAQAQGRSLSIVLDEVARDAEALLDGCYVIQSDVSPDDADARTLHDRYCDLEMVERSFRTMKTTHLDLRPLFVRKEESTKGHVLVVMLALLLQRELERCWRDLDTTVKEGIDELGAISVQEVQLGKASVQNIPTPNKTGRQLLKKIDVQLPAVLPMRKARVDTTKKLQSERIQK